MNQPALGIAFALLLAGCTSAEPEPAGPSDAARQAAVRAAEAELDKAPGDPARARTLARAELDAGHAGRAHALFLYAAWLSPKGDARDKLDNEAREAERAGSAAAPQPAGSHERDRPNRTRDEALRLYREKSYAQALEKLEKLQAQDDRDPRIPRLIAASHLKLGSAAAEEEKFAEAVNHLWAAADADPAARTTAVYRDVARLERRQSVQEQAKGNGPRSIAALRRAFRASPGELETLYQLTRRKDVPAEERAWCERLLKALHPNQAEADFLATAQQVEKTKDPDSASRIVDQFASSNPREVALIADLRALVADKVTGEASRDAKTAKEKYEAALKEARAKRVDPGTEDAKPE